MSNPAFPRMRRVNSILKQVVATELEALKDPRLGMVTITGIETQPNLRRATVFFDTLELERADEARQGLEAAAPRLRRAIGEHARLKYTPALEFELDAGVTQGERMEALFRNLADEHPSEEE